MNNKNSLILITMLWLGFGCASEKEEASDDLSADVLQGTWKLIKFINHGAGDTTWSEYTDNTLYLKHLTPTHFTWIRYEKAEDDLPGTGGGSYTFDGKIYTEDIQFFFPPGSGELGQAIPFTVEIKDQQWFHTGYAKVTEFDPEIGEIVVVDSSKIEEIWIKIDPSDNIKNTNIDLIGTWELVKYKESGDSIYSEYPSFIGYMKHITPTHFNWIYYNAEGDEIISEGGGTYEIDGTTYTERIDFHYPSGSPMIGMFVPFQCKVENGLWYHSGYILVPKTDPATGEMVGTDSSKIDEVWRRIKIQETESTSS